MNLVLEYAFNYINLYRVYAKSDAEREHIMNFYRKLGFQVEGRMREHEYVNGRFLDKHLVAILRSEWLAQTQGRE